MAKVRAKGVYGTPWSKLSKIKLSPKVFAELGTCLIENIVKEAKKDFAKRGWSGRARWGDETSPLLWDSFSYNIVGKNTLVIESTFPGIAELTSKTGIPPRKMVWLTQEARGYEPESEEKPPTMKPSTLKVTKKKSKKFRMPGQGPLIVPVRTEGGQVVFRMAPLKMADAWIHPGIARFTFIQRGIKKGRKACIDIIGKEAARQLALGDPTR